MQFRFFIDDLAVEQPAGFAEIQLNLMRDPQAHGIMFEASTSTLRFSGVGANYLKGLKKARGLKAVAIFKSEFKCEPDDEWEELSRGKINFGRYSEGCGTECYVAVSYEQDDCTMLLSNLEDQKVDMDSEVAFDKISALQSYGRLGFTLDMPAKEMLVGAEGRVADEKDRVSFSIFPDNIGARYFIRPSYGVAINESLNTTNLIPTVFAAANAGFSDRVLTPQLLLDETVDCFDGEFDYEFVFKGSFALLGAILAVNIIVAKGELPEDNEFPTGLTELDRVSIPWSEGAQTGTFSHTFFGDTTLEQGEGIWAFFEVQQFAIDEAGSYIEFDPETSMKITALKKCEDTQSKVYMVYESMSRVVEAITNNCLRVRSDYYGRTDSEPFAAEKDGCGSLRAINSGLQLRNAENAKLFLSWKDIFEGLNPIDNIGVGIEADPLRPGYDLVRVEDVGYFYRDEEAIYLPKAVGVITSMDEAGHWSLIKTGYQKWEVEAIKGLDEIHSTREFRTSFTAINKTLDIVSKWVAGSFAIENTRQQNFATTGAADTKYDNETFIYALKRSETGFAIEQGGADNTANLFSPSTVYNWKIRPIYNLMRWFKSIAAGYTGLWDSDSKLFFTQGTGNYLAKGEQVDAACKLEAKPMAENTDMRVQDFADVVDGTPLWKPEKIKFKYPLSVAEYKKIKARLYGYVSVECGNGGEILKGYIDNLQFSPIQGEAEFTLRMKW